jgi:hypothetical protein
MTINRNPPLPLKREVLVEAGHRCAIPTCRQTTTEIAHIIPWSKVKKHEFDNLIALCPNCHTRFDNKEIDRKSMIQYKMNLSIVNSRYGDLEQRILKIFAANPQQEFIYIYKYLDILLMYVIEDELIEKDESHSLLGEYSVYELTDKGKTFIDKWVNAESVE